MEYSLIFIIVMRQQKQFSKSVAHNQHNQIRYEILHIISTKSNSDTRLKHHLSVCNLVYSTLSDSN
ncbi:hypothetical protein Hanom_Chr15g01397741 [Helianthus anomalus]